MTRSNLCAIALAALGALALVACQAPPAPSTGAEPVEATTLPPPSTEMPMSATTSPTMGATEAGGLEGSWTLVSYGSATAPTPVPIGVEVTAKFAAGKVGGKGGCNVYGADYTVSGTTMTISPATSTMMACEDPAMQMERDYLAALGQVTSYEAAEGALTLMYGEGQALVYKAAPSGLEGTSWSVTGYNNGKQAVTSLALYTEISLAFSSGQVTGKACNSYNGPFTQEGDQLTIGPLATTRMMCPEPGVMEQEAAYLTALQAATTWAVDGSSLTLRDGQGATQVTATTAPAP